MDANYRYVDVDGQGGIPDQPPVREARPPEQLGGIGAWNDFSATAGAAREALVEAAGVEVPDREFVVICLTLYLVAVMVPLNWIVFNALGRVEWAWIAAPVIALVGTWLIVDRARLDIGFARAQTEISVLELQPNYDRGHLARYTALYTSLSTTYDLAFENSTTVAAPFSTSPQRRGTAGTANGVCTYERFENVKLSNVFVPSNTTNMVHSEEMFPLDGAIRLGQSQSQGRLQIENRTKLRLRSVALVERTSRKEEESGRKPGLRGLWIGDLGPRESRPVIFSLPVAADAEAAPFAAERAAEERLQNKARLNLEPLFQLRWT